MQQDFDFSLLSSSNTGFTFSVIVLVLENTAQLEHNTIAL